MIIEGDEKTVAKLMASGKTFALVFYRKDCPVCRRYIPKLRVLSDMGKDIVLIEASKHRDLLRKLEVFAVPTTIIIKGGRIDRVIEGDAQISSLIIALG